MLLYTHTMLLQIQWHLYRERIKYIYFYIYNASIFRYPHLRYIQCFYIYTHTMLLQIQWLLYTEKYIYFYTMLLQISTMLLQIQWLLYRYIEREIYLFLYNASSDIYIYIHTWEIYNASIYTHTMLLQIYIHTWELYNDQC